MIKRPQTLLIFICSFLSFLLGWFFAVFVSPGLKQTRGADSMAQAEKAQDQPSSSFFLDMKKNVLTLFNPDKIDAFSKKDTVLEKENSYLSKEPKAVQLKQPLAVEPKNKAKDDPLSSFKKAFKRLSLQEGKLQEEEEGADIKNPSLEEENLKVQKLKAKYDVKNKAQLSLVDTDFFKLNGKFSFLVNVFSAEDKAFSYVDRMKKDYPQWSFLLKAHKDHVRIYLGPFPSKAKALEFKKAIPNPHVFPSLDYLEEVSL